MKTNIQIHLKHSMLVVGTLTGALGVEASSDYGPAIWRPACSSHHYTTGVGKQFYVEHDMEGYYASTLSYLQGCNNSVSIHYCVNGKQDTGTDMAAGEVSQMVLDSQYAWHAGCWNTHSMGTEHEGFVSNPAWFTEAMYQASAALTSSKADKYGIAKDRNHIVGHNAHQNAAWRSYATGAFGINASCNSHTDPGPYWDWSHYMDLVSGPNFHWSGWYVPTPGYSAAGPCLVNTRSGTLSMFIQGGGNIVYQSRWTGTAWTGWTSLPGVAGASELSACSRAGAMVDLVVRGTDNSIWMKNFNGTTWGSWYVPLAGSFNSSPAIVDMQNGQLSIFALVGSTVYQAIWNGSAWVGWYSMPGLAANSAPAAISRGAGIIDLVVRGTDNNIWMKNFNGTSWGSWYIPAAGAAATGPAIVNTGNGTLSVFIVGGGGILYQSRWNGSSWQGYVAVTGQTGNTTPAACSRYTGMIDFAVRGGDNNIWMSNFQ